MFEIPNKNGVEAMRLENELGSLQAFNLMKHNGKSHCESKGHSCQFLLQRLSMHGAPYR